MDMLFLKLLNMSISATIVVGIVLLLRLLLKKAPKWLHCALWALVGFRLICPFSLESEASLLPSAEVFPSEIISSGDIQIHTGFEAVDTEINSGVLESYMEGVTVPVGNTSRIMDVLTIIWLAGVVLMAGYAVFSYLRLKRKVAASAETATGVYICDYIGSPFILGIWKPQIYLPSDLSKDAAASVLAHERAHLARKDHWWKPVGYLLLAIHWFNPVLWLAYILLCRDIEMACDEKVIRDMTAQEKKQYTEVLLRCSIRRSTIAACPLAFGEVGVKDRVKSVLNYRKPAFWLVLAAIIVCIAAAVCFLTDPVGMSLANQWNINESEITGVVLTAGEQVSAFPEQADIDRVMAFLKKAEIESLPISQNRSEDRPKDFSIRLHNGYRELVFWFDSDFSDVWVGDGVKPSLSYRMVSPEDAQAFFEEMMHTEIPEPVSGGPDENGNYYFMATVLRTTDKTILVEPMEGCWERKSSDLIWVSLRFQSEHPIPEIRVGDRVKVIYDGSIAETYPAQVDWVYEILVEERVVSDQAIQQITAALETDAVTLFDYTAIGELTVLGCKYDGKLGIAYLERNDEVTVVDQETLIEQAGDGWLWQDASKGVFVCVVSDPDAPDPVGIKLAPVWNYPAIVVGIPEESSTNEIAMFPAYVDFGYGELLIPPDWLYDLESPDGVTGVSFWPMGKSEGKITVQFMESFGVCGTGLEENPVRIGDYYGTAGYYDGNTQWSYLVFSAPEGKFVVTREGTCDWWDAEYAALMDILSTLKIARIASQEEIRAEAEALAAYLDYDTVVMEFDSETACWLVHFYRDEGKTLVSTVRMDILGNFLGSES